MQLNSSRALFNQEGDSKSMSSGASTATVDFIDSIVRVQGLTTGFRVDIPVRFAKVQ